MTMTVAVGSAILAGDIAAILADDIAAILAGDVVSTTSA